MEGKKSSPKKLRNEEKKSGKKSGVPKQPVSDDEVADPNDFGGLPKRDLKKNLGCG